MPATATRRAPKPYRVTVRDLAPVVESLPLAESGSPTFRVDRDKGVIFGAKVYGLHSPNSHGRQGVTEGTDYPLDLHKASLSIFEGLTIYGNHPDKVQDAGKVRHVQDAVAVLKNCRVEADGTYGDLHVNTATETGRAMLEDADKKLGMYALSINAMPAKEDVVGGKLVIRQFAYAHSVDVVTRGGTNKTLWESRQEKPVSTTFKAVLEKWSRTKSEPRQRLAKWLLEDDAAAGDTPTESAEGADPEAELWDGFMSAIVAIINGDGSADEKAKKVGKYLKAHEKLTQEPEPKGDKSDVEEEDDSPDADAKKKDADCAMKESRDLRAENACLKAGITDPPKALVKALGLMESQAERDALIAGYRPAAGQTGKPKSSAPTPGRKPGQAVTESAKAPATAADFAKLIRE